MERIEWESPAASSLAMLSTASWLGRGMKFRRWGGLAGPTPGLPSASAPSPLLLPPAGCLPSHASTTTTTTTTTNCPCPATCIVLYITLAPLPFF